MNENEHKWDSEHDECKTRIAALAEALAWHVEECEDCGCTVTMKAALNAGE